MSEWIDETRFTKRCLLAMRRNINSLVETAGRWQRRLNQADLDNVLQALSDLEFTLSVIEGKENVVVFPPPTRGALPTPPPELEKRA